jgi:predicted negative regulator of RcsB-dependent stress response
MEFIARRWWRRVEIWVIAILLVAGGAVLGYQAAQWSMFSWYNQQVADVRKGYDEALTQRDMRLNKLSENTTKAAEKVDRAADKATRAADTADKAAVKATEAVDRASQ